MKTDLRFCVLGCDNIRHHVKYARLRVHVLTRTEVFATNVCILPSALLISSEKCKTPINHERWRDDVSFKSCAALRGSVMNTLLASVFLFTLVKIFPAFSEIHSSD